MLPSIRYVLGHGVGSVALHLSGRRFDCAGVKFPGELPDFKTTIITTRYSIIRLRIFIGVAGRGFVMFIDVDLRGSCVVNV